jgi:hypothetical protein
VHRDLRMIVGPEKVRAADAYRSITKCGSFRGTGNDTDVLGHGLILR